MLYYAALFVAFFLLLYVVPGDVYRRPGLIRCILVSTLFFGIPFGFGEYRSLVRHGHTGSWRVILLYLVAGFIGGCLMWFVERSMPRKLPGELDV
jgi:hypothetical protein